ncbi:STAS-like domain-containing protein [Lonsdalea quercina]|uniref:STAS-like domain-containing protein n=1 Tax=Lonsdalea quercina TaxID=71657 RepID=UPI00397625DD
MNKLNIGHEFSKVPRGRFRTDGDASGERFREDYLRKRINNLKKGEKLTIIIDDQVEGYGSSFLVEGFAGMVKYGYTQADELMNKIEIIHTIPDFSFYKKKIEQYINEAEFDSKKYRPSIND